MKRLLAIATLLMLASSRSGQVAGRHAFTLGATDFLLDGRPLQIISGEMHPARIPAEYWRHRIRMAKAMGCNTVAAYIFWNHHESSSSESEGVFDSATTARTRRA
jgi:beta-galactosidase